ncbi:MAG: polynucleotide adenylyltransferase PcnB [Pseudomonadales bacterium]|nr:polynucleotide adenylyltransferase PcnB [Pseudomonadales bacterium]
MSIPKNAEQNPITAQAPEPRLDIIRREEHCVSRRQISPNSLKILYRLNEAGFQAYIVGGGVRDLLLMQTPKDFDIATDATPEEIKKIFGNARIIGRRFKIVHIQFGREIIEVSTFRAAPENSVAIVGDSLARKVTHLDSAHSENGMLLRDNVYGDIEGDVMRRDFTVNALYYTVQNFAIHDYVQGMADIQRRTLRMIGDPLQRYREDPVRVLRAIRLAAKLDFAIEKNTAAPLQDCARLLESIPPARLFDECLKLFFAGQAQKTYRLLKQYGVFQILFPATGELLDQNDEGTRVLLENALENTDSRIREGKSVTPAFLLAAILWPPLHKLFGQKLAAGTQPLPAMHESAQTIIMAQLERLSIPKRYSIPMREIWEYQLQLPRRSGKHAEIMLGHKRFRAAYDFLLLRESAGEDLQGLGQWWTDYQNASAPEREKMQAEQMKTRHNTRTRKRKRRVKSPGSHSEQ